MILPPVLTTAFFPPRIDDERQLGDRSGYDPDRGPEGVYRSADWALTFTPEADSEPPDTQSMNHWAGFEVDDRLS